MLKQKEDDFLSYECDNGKYEKLLPLYNSWEKATAFRSHSINVGPEWDALVEYCKENKLETLEFFQDLVVARKKEYDNHENGSTFIGWFIEALDECFPGMYTVEPEGSYINPMEVQEMYSVFATLALAPTKDYHLSEELIEKYQIK